MVAPKHNMDQNTISPELSIRVQTHGLEFNGISCHFVFIAMAISDKEQTMNGTNTQPTHEAAIIVLDVSITAINKPHISPNRHSRNDFLWTNHSNYTAKQYRICRH
jgi:hypothetical protein